MNRSVLAVAVAVALALAPPALAKNKGKGKGQEPTIEKCGLASFDAVFAKVAAIDERLTASRRMLGEAKRDLTTALALEKGTSLQDALSTLKEKGARDLTVTTSGGVPKLEARPGAAADLQDAISAVNGLVTGIAGSITELQGIPADAAALVTEASALPKRFKDEAKSAGIKPTEIPKMLKIVKNDVEVAAALPEKAASVVERMTEVVQAVGALAP